jgi:hypothetical protein
MIEFRQLYYKFRTTDTRVEFHVSSARDEVRNSEAMSKAILKTSPRLAKWYQERMTEIREFKMKEVR